MTFGSSLDKVWSLSYKFGSAICFGYIQWAWHFFFTFKLLVWSRSCWCSTSTCCHTSSYQPTPPPDCYIVWTTHIEAAAINHKASYNLHWYLYCSISQVNSIFKFTLNNHRRWPGTTTIVCEKLFTVRLLKYLGQFIQKLFCSAIFDWAKSCEILNRSVLKPKYIEFWQIIDGDFFHSNAHKFGLSLTLSLYMIDLNVNPLDAGRRSTDFAQTPYAARSLLTDGTVYERSGW